MFPLPHVFALHWLHTPARCRYEQYITCWRGAQWAEVGTGVQPSADGSTCTNGQIKRADDAEGGGVMHSFAGTIEIAAAEPAAGRPPAWTEDTIPSTQVDGRRDAPAARFQSPAA